MLIAVFIPMAFFPGSVGIIYRQFSIAMVTSIAFSAFPGASLTPALCATLLKPIEKGHGHARAGFFGWFNPHRRPRDRPLRPRGAVVDRQGRPDDCDLPHPRRRRGWAFVRLPEGFLPVEDQGFFTVDIQTPARLVVL